MDLHLNESFELMLEARKYLRSAPLEDIFKPEVLAALHADGLTDEDIRNLLMTDDELKEE